MLLPKGQALETVQETGWDKATLTYDSDVLPPSLPQKCNFLKTPFYRRNGNRWKKQKQIMNKILQVGISQFNNETHLFSVFKKRFIFYLFWVLVFCCCFVLF